MLIKCRTDEQKRYEEYVRGQFTQKNNGEAREAVEIIARGTQAALSEMRKRETEDRI